jgi:hypothetical protein
MVARKGTCIPIGGYRFRQRWVDKAMLDARGNWADSDLERGEILLADVTDRQRAIETLLHEVIEIIGELYELKLKHSQVQALGVGLSQAIQHLIRKWW